MVTFSLWKAHSIRPPLGSVTIESENDRKDGIFLSWFVSFPNHLILHYLSRSTSLRDLVALASPLCLGLGGFFTKNDCLHQPLGIHSAWYFSNSFFDSWRLGVPYSGAPTSPPSPSQHLSASCSLHLCFFTMVLPGATEESLKAVLHCGDFWPSPTQQQAKKRLVIIYYLLSDKSKKPLDCVSTWLEEQISPAYIT